MKKKTMITIGTMVGAGLGAVIITDILMRRSVRIEKEDVEITKELKEFLSDLGIV